MYDIGSTMAPLPQRIPGKALSVRADYPIDATLTRFRGVARVHPGDRLSLWTLISPACAGPTFDQLLRIRDYLRALE
jgi:hypothetical protein